MAPKQNKENQAPKKEAPKEAEKPTEHKKKHHKKKQADEPMGFLQSVRPRPRWIFFVTFAIGCAWMCWCYEPCNIKGKRQDCGYSGISTFACRTTACFTKGGGKMNKVDVKVERKASQALGLELVEKETASQRVVVSIGDGAVQEYNAGLPEGSADKIKVGDILSKVDGYTGSGIAKANSATTEKTIAIEIQRSKLPSWLRWIRDPLTGKPGKLVEKVITSPGFEKFSQNWAKVAGVGTSLWLVSGYPLASLPMYWLISAGVSWHTTRCCHEPVQSGPHCYKGKRDAIEDVAQQALEFTMKKVDKIKEDPQAYAKSWFQPPDLMKLVK